VVAGTLAQWGKHPDSLDTVQLARKDLAVRQPVTGIAAVVVVRSPVVDSAVLRDYG
jgi:hypothetical protein